MFWEYGFYCFVAVTLVVVIREIVSGNRHRKLVLESDRALREDLKRLGFRILEQCSGRHRWCISVFRDTYDIPSDERDLRAAVFAPRFLPADIGAWELQKRYLASNRVEWHVVFQWRHYP